MAHFCLLVVTQSPDDVAEALRPYWDDDNEARRQPHFVFVPDSPQGAGFWRNPVGKWDGWIVGGRWSGLLRGIPEAREGMSDAAGDDAARDQMRLADLAPEILATPGPLDAVHALLIDGEWRDAEDGRVSPRDFAADLRRRLSALDGARWITVVDCHC